MSIDPSKSVPAIAFRLNVLILKEDDGTFSGIVLNLPGAGSCGASEVEVIENVREAVGGLIESYRAAGDAIPWKDTSGAEIPAGAKQKWILMDA